MIRSHTKKTRLGAKPKDFGFIVSIIRWYYVLFQINVMIKASQSLEIDFVQFTEMLIEMLLINRKLQTDVG